MSHDQPALHNTHPALWVSYQPDRKEYLEVRDGHILSNQAGALARFNNTKDAEDCLTGAGWSKARGRWVKN